MGKLKTLIAGLLLGTAGMYVCLQYHVLLAPEGFLLVPRAPQHRLQDTYANVQTWDAQSWASRPRLSLAVTEHGRTDLIRQHSHESFYDDLHGSEAPPESLDSPAMNAKPLGEATGHWEPAGSSDELAPITDGKIANQRGSARQGSGARRGFLSLAELFGFTPPQPAQRHHPADEPKKETVTPVLPANSANPPKVEFLPPPSNVELGMPQPIPRGSGSRWRQSKNDVEESPRTVSRQSAWEPLTALPDDLKSS